MTEMPQTAAVPDWTLGWRLQRSLAHANLGVEDMARELGVSRSTLSRWMNDRGTPPRPIYIRQWAMICGVPDAWLLHGDNPPPSTIELDRRRRRDEQGLRTGRR